MEHAMDTDGWLHVEWEEAEDFTEISGDGVEVVSPPGSPEHKATTSATKNKKSKSKSVDPASELLELAQKEKAAKKKTKKSHTMIIADPDPVAIARKRVQDLFNKKANKGVRNNFAVACAAAEQKKGGKKKEKVHYVY